MQQSLSAKIVATSVLIFSVSTAETRKPIPRWTSTLQCLAPLALEARKGQAALKLDQAFFDGPFRLMQESADAPERDELALGFERLLAFDDREAERAFRGALLKSGENPDAWVGLAIANLDSKRRVTCFLDAAYAATPDPGDSAWIALLRRGILSEDSSALDEWLNLATNSEDPFRAIALLRHLMFQAATGKADSRFVEFVESLSTTFPEIGDLPLFPDSIDASKIESRPQWHRLAAEQFLSEGKTAEATEQLRETIVEEFARLQAIGQVMPEASLNLGETSGRLLRLLLDHGQDAEVQTLATSLLALPRDSYSIENKWRRLDREKTVWVVARKFLAEVAFKNKEFTAIEALPAGFTSRDKAEWFFWRAMANQESGEDINLWLAALRRERAGSDLVAALENYLYWKEEGEWLEEVSFPGVPSTWYRDTPDTPATLQAPFSTDGLITPIKQAAAPFSLENWKNEKVTLAQHAGEPVLIIFFLGGGCLHCVEQLTAFGPRAEKYAAAGIKMLAVSTDPVEILTETLSENPEAQAAFPIPIVSNENLDVFRDWGAYDEFDGRAIHGTFLLNAEGEIIWKETGNAPYMHGDYLLQEAKRLLEIP